MSFIVLASAMAFSCASPTHHDGDAIRCAGAARSDRLFGIDAPEMPGACRPGRACTPGDPFAARDHLASLTRGHIVECTTLDRDHYGRRIVRCVADGQDLSCAMIADGYAVPRHGKIDCASAPGRRDAEQIVSVRSGPGLVWLAGALWLLMINVAAYLAFAIDKSRAKAGSYRRVRRIPESTLLWLAAVGGSIGAIIAQQKLRHKTIKQPFATLLLVIAGVQLGLVIGVLILTQL